MQVRSTPIIDAFPACLTYQHIGIPTSIFTDSQYASNKPQLINEFIIETDQVVTLLIWKNSKETIKNNNAVINSWQRQLTVIWLSHAATIHPS